jgi:hypothetical protein
MDSFSQDFRITSYHLIAPKIVQVSPEIGAEGAYNSFPEHYRKGFVHFLFSFVNHEQW